MIADVTRAALSAGGALARAHPGFVVRGGQLEMAEAIARAIETSGALIAEAGTGTGKTYAYLVPALAAGVRVLIATGTRTLQDQLFGRDLPEVRNALGVAARTALLKGRANYVCHYHLARSLLDGRFARREDIADLRRIERYAAVSQGGDRSGLSALSEDAPAWLLATSTRENCLGQDCPDHGRCFVFRARQEAMQSDIVVVNHHLFCADLALRDEGVSELLPTCGALVFDEAHQLPDIATQFFGSSVSARQLLEFGRDALRAGMAEARDAGDWIQLGARMEAAVRELRLAAGAPARLDRQALRGRAELLEALQRAVSAVESLGNRLDAAAVRGKELARCALRAAELRERIDQWRCSLTDEAESTSEDRIVWADVAPNGLTLHATPMSIAGVFARHRQARPRAWIFLSATLAVGGRLDHFASTIGMEDAQLHVWPSPFDFAQQALLYVPTDVGLPSATGFAERLVSAVWPLIVANRGRAFLLCTTLRMVDRAAELIEERLAEADLEPAAGVVPMLLLRQGQASRADLLERFRAHPAPILIGSASFWEGVDVPGDQLSLVIIDKLPFAPPDDPIVQARSRLLRAHGHDPFRAMHLPAAAMVLKQGAGRLIRSERDRGVLVVGDARLAERNYGRALLRSLPPFRRTRDPGQALAFIRGDALQDA